MRVWVTLLTSNTYAIYLKDGLDMKEAPNSVKRILKIFAISAALFGFLGIGTLSAQDGEKIFKSYCTACHKIDQDMIGPKLEGVMDRWEGKEDLLHQWIKNPASLMDSDDPYISAMIAEWLPRGGLMTAQNLSDEEIDAVLAYIESGGAPADGQAGVAAAPTETPHGAKPEPTGGLSTTLLVIIFFILLILVFSLWGVRSSLTHIDRSMKEREGIAIPEPLPFGKRMKQWMWNNRVGVSVGGILIVAILCVKGYEGLMGIGVYQGYHPEQPIEFNHTLHAGVNQISCVYCHHQALESRHAGIPSANVCMNCHKGISEGRSPKGTEDIQKIYEAVGWDPSKMEYTGEEKPIRWVKVHNLPDHAYFNHMQHYVVAGIECQECHGQVQEEFVTAEQHAELTMGWCVDCHNTTKVNMDGNGYYEDIHQRLVDNGREELKKYLEDGKITARELGGWECAKCHY